MCAAEVRICVMMSQARGISIDAGPHGERDLVPKSCTGPSESAGVSGDVAGTYNDVSGYGSKVGNTSSISGEYTSQTRMMRATAGYPEYTNKDDAGNPVTISPPVGPNQFPPIKSEHKLTLAKSNQGQRSRSLQVTHYFPGLYTTLDKLLR